MRIFSFLFTFFHINFAKNIWSVKKLQTYKSDAVVDSGRDLPPCSTAVGGARYCSTFYRRGPRR
jgi:hypothetical protein